MKESGKERLKQAIYESTLSTADAVPLPQWGNAIKLSGRTFLAPHRGSSPKGEARRYVANDFLNLIALPNGEGKLVAATPPF